MGISAFHDVLFPARIAFGATVTTNRKVEVVSMASGREHRNLRHAHSRRTYDAGTGMKSFDDVRTVLAFFEARRGPLTAFRFRDPIDNSSRLDGAGISMTDQLLGTGDGTKLRFALTKTYGQGADAYIRPIRFPDLESLMVSVGGALKSPASYSWDVQTGELVFGQDHAPASGQVVRAGFDFHVAVRFANEAISANVSAFDAGDIPSIPLVEVL